MKINIKATNMDLTDEISTYLTERVESLSKFIDNKAQEDGSVMADVEVGTSSNHHQSGEIYRAEINLTVSGQLIRAVSEKSDLFLAIDDMRDQAQNSITSSAGKKRDLLRKGGAMVKNMLRGFKK